MSLSKVPKQMYIIVSGYHEEDTVLSETFKSLKEAKEFVEDECMDTDTYTYRIYSTKLIAESEEPTKVKIRWSDTCEAA